MTGPRGRASAADAGVRPAVARDISAIADVHVRAWQASYGDVLPPQLTGALSPAHLGEAWRAAVQHPPSTAHRVLVATAADLVLGFAAAAPATEPDGGDGDIELVALEVDPAHRGSGHGSRLLNAAVDTARDAGATRIIAWLPEVDGARAGFFAAAGLEPDGAERTMADESGTRWTERRVAAVLGSVT